MSDSVQSYFGIALLKEDGLDLDLLDVGDLSKIVDIVVGARLVQSAEHVQPNWVIMITMDREYWQTDAQGRIQVIRFFELMSFECMLFLLLFLWVARHFIFGRLPRICILCTVLVLRVEDMSIEYL